MGDRGNIIIQGGSMFPHPLYLYTHWSGSDLPKILKAALVKGKDRWHDPQYLARVIFQQMIGKDNDITGYGLSTEQGDGGIEIYVDMDANTVRFRDGTKTFAEYAGNPE